MINEFKSILDEGISIPLVHFMFSLFYLATQSPSFLSSLTFYTVPDGNYTMLTGDQFHLNCTAGGRYDIYGRRRRGRHLPLDTKKVSGHFFPGLKRFDFYFSVVVDCLGLSNLLPFSTSLYFEHLSTFCSETLSFFGSLLLLKYLIHNGFEGTANISPSHSCRPVPRILWYKDGSLINDSGDLFQHHRFNRTLRLGSLSSKIHDGRYMCQAVSPSGDLTTSFDVKVIGMKLSELDT